MHDYVPVHCVNCGGYLGVVCEDCGNMSDGGDHMAANEDIWCKCGNSVSDYEIQDSGEENGVNWQP